MSGPAASKLRSRSRFGFSLVEILVGMLVLALSVTSSLEVLRLSEVKARHSRVDDRVTEVVRENSDYLMYVAYDLLPGDGALLNQGSLYQVYDPTTQTWKNLYNYTITVNVQAPNQASAPEVKNLTFKMSYQVDSYFPNTQLKSETVISDVISRRKP
jgi:prepilin-type N-terminal cleavage/methylation domain-containing protein